MKNLTDNMRGVLRITAMPKRGTVATDNSSQHNSFKDMITNENNIRRSYEKPTVRVYELHSHRSMILCASPLGDPSDYLDGGDPFGF